MTMLNSTLDSRSNDYRVALDSMIEKLSGIEEELTAVLAGGGEKAVARHHDRDKFTARERIELLVDRDTPFLELCPLAAWGSTAFRSRARLRAGSTSSSSTISCFSREA